MDESAGNCFLEVRKSLGKWEDEINPLAPLGADERDSILEITTPSFWHRNTVSDKLVSNNEPPDVSSHSSDNKHQNENISTNSDREQTIFDGIDSPIESSLQFLKWYATLEVQMGKEEDSPYEDYIVQLKNHKEECTILLKELNEAFESLQALSDQYTSVSTKTSSLHTDCEHLLSEQTRLTNGADTIESKLYYYHEVDKIAQKLNSPAIQVSSEGFISTLNKINQGINYMKMNPTYKESGIFLAKYNHCLNRSLSMIKTYVTKSLENALKKVLPLAGVEKPNMDNALILYYGKFRLCAPRIKVLMTEIEDRVDVSPEYSNLLNDCHQCYFAQRKMLLHPCVAEAITQLTQKYSKDYCSLVRTSCAFLVHVCEDEHSLFHQFFSMPSNELETFTQGLCFILYDVLRPLIIHIDHLETLSELCNILRRGMIEEHIQNNPIQLSSLTSVVNQLLQDCQERLIYRAQIYLQTDVVQFNPSSGDLAYPSKLEMMESIAESIALQQNRSVSVSSLSSVCSSVSEDRPSMNVSEGRSSRVGSSPADLHGMWYPSVRRTLMCLSKVYRSVDRSIFQGISLEAVSSCMQSLSIASTAIAKNSTLLDAQLFEVKHLLILREQLAPFQVDASLREMSLDWSKLKDAAFSLVHKRDRLFSFKSNNAFLEFVVEGTPQVTEQILDCKRDVDAGLKEACERLIRSTTESIISPLTAFNSQVDVVTQINAREKDVKPVQLKNQPFASPQKIAEVITTTQKNMKARIPVIKKSFRLYLSNKDTELILFKPIRINILHEYKRASQVIKEIYGEEEDNLLLIACPSQEEVSLLLTSLYEQ